MQKYPLLASAIGALATIALAAPAAQANPRICRQLEHEARELRQTGSGASRASLQRELNQVERQVRRAGCSGFRLLFGGVAKRQCHALRADLDRLRQQVGGASLARSPDRRLRNVEAEMRHHGCSARSQRAARGGGHHSGGGYQTLCVRKCDGYYFPIGFATAKRDLQRDQAACNSFYPDGAAELYIRPSGSDEAAAMVSLDGKDYAGQSFAFAYRSAYQPACAAMLHAGVGASERQSRQTVAIKASAIVPIPVPRPSPGDDTKPIVNASDRGSIVSAKVDTGIRVVGPATPYLVSNPFGEAIAPVAANSAPKRVAPADQGAAASWLDRISALIAPAAQADEGG